jgi:hypothetical protein
MPFNLALEAHNLGGVLHMPLALLPLVRGGLVLVVGVASKSTLVIWELLPLMTLYQVLLKRRDLGLELFDFPYMVSNNTSTRGSGTFIVRATRQGM